MSENFRQSIPPLYIVDWTDYTVLFNRSLILQSNFIALCCTYSMILVYIVLFSSSVIRLSSQ